MSGFLPHHVPVTTRYFPTYHGDCVPSGSMHKTYHDYLPRPRRYDASKVFKAAANSASSSRLLAELIHALGKSLVKLNGKAESLFTHKEFYPKNLFDLIDINKNEKVVADELHKFLGTLGIKMFKDDVTRATAQLF